jgi:hypothetical protein
MRSCRVRYMVIGATVALLTAACTDGESAPSVTSNGGGIVSEAQEAMVVAVDYEFSQAPAQLHGGVINLRFENHGTVPHELALAGIGDTPLEGWADYLNSGGTGLEGPFPDYLDQVVLSRSLLTVRPGQASQASFALTPGRYAMVCAYTRVAKGDQPAPTTSSACSGS